ncbi:endonuclease VII domain-containing protein [Streptomyces sp. NPDC001774]
MTDRPLCKECPPALKRPAPNPGPRCATHWRLEKKRRKDDAHAKRVLRTYGLDDYPALHAFQGGRCAICRRATGASKQLAVDHDHSCCPGPNSCGQCIRGLLCSICNRLLGHGRDDPQFFKRVIAYLYHPPAQSWAATTAGDPHAENLLQSDPP